MGKDAFVEQCILRNREREEKERKAQKEREATEKAIKNIERDLNPESEPVRRH